MTVMKALRELTWDTHLRLEKRLDIKRRFSELARYREHIARLEAFHRAAEAEWRPALEQVLPDLEGRRKAPLLARDLAALGGTLVARTAVPFVADAASALGAFYVLEGATLGGQRLLPQLEARLGVSASHGASFFASYGPQTKVMWALFGEAVERHCASPDAENAALAAAQATFLAVEAWLCAEPISGAINCGCTA